VLQRAGPRRDEKRHSVRFPWLTSFVVTRFCTPGHAGTRALTTTADLDVQGFAFEGGCVADPCSGEVILRARY